MSRASVAVSYMRLLSPSWELPSIRLPRKDIHIGHTAPTSPPYYSYCYSYRYSLPPLTLQLFPPLLHLLLHLLLHVCYTTRLGPANGLLYWHARIWSPYNAVVAEKRNTCIELACAVACRPNTAPWLRKNTKKSNECPTPFSRVEVCRASPCYSVQLFRT